MAAQNENTTFSIMSVSHQRFLAILSIIFLGEFILLAISPHDRSDWLLENVLVAVFIAAVFMTYKKFPFSRISYTLIFLFLFLHEIGAHFTYAKVPYDSMLQSFLGLSLNDLMGWERNHFDRLVHFSYGLLLAYPIRELYCRIANAKGFWGYFFPLDLAMASSMMFELFEWGAAEFFGGDLGAAYLGTQGDIWDAHKDMALASIGACIAMLLTMAINMRIQRNFADEWSYSLKVKKPVPLGEDEIKRLLEKK